jgi:hypothetical protein
MELRAPRSTIGAPPQELTLEEAAFAKAASAWVGQLGRTLKTCRLYDAANPTVLKFREDLAIALAQLLPEHASLALTFSSTDVSWNGVPLYRARSRDDNIGLPFYRDGIRTMTFTAGVEPREVEALVDALLAVTGQSATNADLVTLLWDAELVHVNVDYVSAAADADGEGTEPMDTTGAAPLMPWPKEAPAADAKSRPSEPDGSLAGAGEAVAETPRSDDWTPGEYTQLAEDAFGEIEAGAPLEMKRFHGEHDAECQASVLGGTLELLCECLDAGATAGDREELAHFLPRLLQEAIALGAWADARRAVQLLHDCAGPGAEPLAGLLRELAQPDSVVTVNAVRELDRQEPRDLEGFLAFGLHLGQAAFEWLMLILTESQQERVRRLLARLLTDLCRETPERLAPWLADPRWFVVRNAVHVLGGIGGQSIVPLLRTVAGHAEPHVRQEVVTALAGVELRATRGLLLEMLAGADTRMLCTLLHQLSRARDPEVARWLMARLQAADFRDRPVEEKRAIYSTLSRVGDDAILPQLEEELHRGRWFAGGHDDHRKDIVRCIARLGTPAAREILKRGARSRSADVRATCTSALSGVENDD